MKILNYLLASILIFVGFSVIAIEIDEQEDIEKNSVLEKVKKEKNNSFYSITPYKSSYFLPINYTAKPFESIYKNESPNNQNPKPLEAKFQFSFKIPVWQNILNESRSLYIAYTQLSYWQAYTRSGFIRETNHEPELFLANSFHTDLLPGWKFNFLNIGISHQSNGQGDDLERGWDRIYLEGIFSSKNWMVSLKPWYPIRQATLHYYNPDIAKYLGYGRLLVGWRNNNNQIFSLELRNTLESRFKRASIQVDWSFPLNNRLSGYIQFFSGYGQGLIEYNHHTNSIGIGLSLNRWL